MFEISGPEISDVIILFFLLNGLNAPKGEKTNKLFSKQKG